MSNKQTLSQFVADRVKQLRKEQRLTQETLSEVAQLDVKYVNKLENYRHTARLETLEQLIEALGVTYSEFFNFEIQADSNTIESLLYSLTMLPKDKQEKKIKAIIELLND